MGVMFKCKLYGSLIEGVEMVHRIIISLQTKPITFTLGGKSQFLTYIKWNQLSISLHGFLALLGNSTAEPLLCSQQCQIRTVIWQKDGFLCWGSCYTFHLYKIKLATEKKISSEDLYARLTPECQEGKKKELSFLGCSHGYCDFKVYLYSKRSYQCKKGRLNSVEGRKSRRSRDPAVSWQRTVLATSALPPLATPWPEPGFRR